MKRLLSIIVAFLLCISLASCRNAVANSNDLLLSVLDNKTAFITEQGTRVLIQDYKIGESKSLPAVAEKYAFVDMDGDGAKELVVYVSSDYGAYLVFRLKGASVYGYEFGARSFVNLREDGTFVQSGGAGVNSFVHLRFDGIDYTVVYDAIADDMQKVYRINGAEVAKAEADAFVDGWYKRKSPEWTELQSANSDKSPFYREHQQLTSTETVFKPDTALRFDLPEVGLKNVFIRCVEWGVRLDKDTVGSVYLLADDRYGGEMGMSDHYLAVKVGDKLQLTDALKWDDQACISGTLDVCDVDGDGDDEILLQETVGMTGGAGQYLSRIYDYKNGQMVEVFSSYIGDSGSNFDTGFFAEILTDKKLRIHNRFTDYELMVDFSDREEGYFGFWYNEDGKPKDNELMVDSFYTFEPWDQDGDGVYEIRCYQYTSLISHTDYVGAAVSILKYNTETDEWRVIAATFEPEND